MTDASIYQRAFKEAVEALVGSADLAVQMMIECPEHAEEWRQIWVDAQMCLAQVIDDKVS